MASSFKQRIAPLLLCPVCDPSVRLVAPTTLHCGHTVCSSHVLLPEHDKPSSSKLTMPSCPVPDCKPSSHRDPTPRIHADSSVAYYPAPSSFPPAKNVRVSETRIDVRISKIMALLDAPDRNIDDAPSPRTYDNPSESEYEEEQTDAEADDRDTTDASGPSAPELMTSPVPPPPLLAARHFSDRDSPPPVESHRSKKRRRHRSTPSLDPTTFEQELLTELTCEICFMLLHEPTTTPCQHSFCSKCFQRSLDHGLRCPLCRQDLPSYTYFHDHAPSQILLSILLVAFSETYRERGEALEAEARNARLDTPLFVCQLSFPKLPTLLHFFEPRYRLMLRRCLESPTPRFGMIMPSSTGSTGQEYGTMLEIRSVQMLPDGRSLVKTQGSFRFRILERGQFDGYMVGRIERIDDVDTEMEVEVRNLASISGPSGQRLGPTNAELIAKCHAFLDQLRNGAAPWVVRRLDDAYGPMPTDDEDAFAYWMALVLPIDETEKAKLFPIRSLHLRLCLIVHWIEELQSNWWFSSGCIIA